MEVLCVKCSKQFLKDTMSDKEYQDLMRENEELNE